jgi:hypothetical protein
MQDTSAAAYIIDSLHSKVLDEVAQSLVVLYESHGMGVALIKFFIDIEMAKAHTSEGMCPQQQQDDDNSDKTNTTTTATRQQQQQRQERQRQQ